MAASAPPRYGLIQIEPTSQCNLRCQTCLRASNPEQWQERDLPFSLFRQVSKEFKQADTIHLQGWGEPLILGSFIRYLKTAKENGCRVSFTTNGQVMKRELAVSLVRSGVDAITFSIAGASAETQDPLRGSGSFVRLQASISILAAAKRKLHSQTPVLAVSYLLTPTTIEELPGAVRWCGKQGISLLAGVHLTHAANAEQQRLQLFPTNDRHIRKLIRKAHIRALFAGVRLELPPLQPTMVPVCAKNPVHNLSIAADGSVAPCVFLNTPLSSPVQWQGKNRSIGPAPYAFGNIFQQRLKDIWNKSAYKEFRISFIKRQRLYQQALARVGYDMNGIEQLELAKRKIRKGFADNPAPLPCRQCPKLCGY